MYSYLFFFLCINKHRAKNQSFIYLFLFVLMDTKRVSWQEIEWLNEKQNVSHPPNSLDI